MSFGYDSRTIFTKAVTDIDDAAAMFLDRIDGERQSAEGKARPLILIAHSLGGIVVKRFVLERLSTMAY
jgi:alpha-beta hydrolase superfamily lysophospholipase